MSGTKLFLFSDLISGLHIINVKDAFHPHEIQNYLFLTAHTVWFLDSPFLFISHGNDGVSKVDITNLSNPTALLEAKFPCTHFRIYADYLYCINLDLITVATISTLEKERYYSENLYRYAGWIYWIRIFEYKRNIGRKLSVYRQ